MLLLLLVLLMLLFASILHMKQRFWLKFALVYRCLRLVLSTRAVATVSRAPIVIVLIYNLVYTG